MKLKFVFFLLLGLFPSLVFAVPTCDGNACGSISANYNGSRWVFSNHSGRKVRVVVDGVWTGSATMDLAPGQSQACFFTAFKNPYHANYLGAPPLPPINPGPARPQPVDVANVTLSNNNIGLGESTVLTIYLTRPAPPSGLTIAIDVNSDGAQDTLKTSPVSITILAGRNSGTFPLQTQSVVGSAKKIIFTAHTYNGVRRSVQLNITH